STLTRTSGVLPIVARRGYCCKNLACSRDASMLLLMRPRKVCHYVSVYSRACAPSVRWLPMEVPQRLRREYRSIKGPLPTSGATGYMVMVILCFSNDNVMLRCPRHHLRFSVH